MLTAVGAAASALVVLAVPAAVIVGANSAPRVELAADEAARRVDVRVDGKPFTAYIWPDRLKKPVLFPLRTARGTVVTRGYPLEPRSGEHVDHPHHAGLWLNYGDVNGVDFWGNSEALTPQEQAKAGVIRHRAVRLARGGAGQGELDVEADWIMPDGSVGLREHTRYVFRAGPEWRSVDRLTMLTAGDKRMVFNDTKEGMLGLRVARSLEMPAQKPEPVVDAEGRTSTAPGLDNTPSTGSYLSSEGVRGEKVWGTRGRWMALEGTVDNEPVTLAMFDHPGNPGFPTYWHARGYGLFAANPLGQKVFSEGKEQLNFTLEPGKSTTFRHRILIASSKLTPEQLEARYREFTSARP